MISRPTLEVRWTNEQNEQVVIGSVGCDFAESTGRRGWANQYDLTDSSDNGWLFNQDWLPTPGSTTTAKLYLQFKVNPSGPNDDINWKRINGHRILFTVDHVDLKAEIGGRGTPPENYAYIVDPAHPEVQSTHATIVRTRNDGQVNGAATGYLQAGPQIEDAAKVAVFGYDLSQWDH